MWQNRLGLNHSSGEKAANSRNADSRRQSAGLEIEDRKMRYEGIKYRDDERKAESDDRMFFAGVAGFGDVRVKDVMITNGDEWGRSVLCYQY